LQEFEPISVTDSIGGRAVGVLLSAIHQFELNVVFGGFTARLAGLVFMGSLFHVAGGQAQLHLAAQHLVK